MIFIFIGKNLILIKNLLSRELDSFNIFLEGTVYSEFVWLNLKKQF